MNARKGLLQLTLVLAILGLTGWGAALWADPAIQADLPQAAPCDRQCDSCDQAPACDEVQLAKKDSDKKAVKKVQTAKKDSDKKAVKEVQTAKKADPKKKAPAQKADPKKSAPAKNQDKPDAESVKKPAPSHGDKEEKEDPHLKKLKEEAQRLSAESQAASARLEAELRKAKEEIQRLQTQMELESTKQKAKLAKMEREQAEIQARMAFEETRMKAEMAERQKKVNRKAAEIAIRNKELENQLADRQQEIQKIKGDLAYKAALAEKKLAETALENQRLATEAETITARMQLNQLKLQEALAKKTAKVNEMAADIALRSQRESWQTGVNDPLEYSERPFRNGKLVISDRRIELNGPIWDNTAKDVTEKIHFYNNQSEKLPIFIVIDESPGGSVASGAQILQAMKSSKAPIHVVVKRFAASMAAVITTLAEQSYAYPNAMILHHQPSSGNSGNTTQQKEGLDMILKWEKRFAGPVADKMGITIEEFRKKMYENNSDGDWMEFADGARKLRWVDHLVTDCHEQSVRKKPENSGGGWFIFFKADQPDIPFGLKMDQYGKPYFQLPPLTNPFDAWFIHNPNGFYRR